jgi:cytochrome oxidase assembly protein ShyY1
MVCTIHATFHGRQANVNIIVLELILVLAVALGLGFWQLYDVNKALKKHEDADDDDETAPPERSAAGERERHRDRHDPPE